MAGDADVVWIYGGSRLATRENMPLLTRCRGIIRSGSGVDHINMDAASENGIVVVNVPHAHHDAVSDHTIALMFAVGQHIVSQSASASPAGLVAATCCRPGRCAVRPSASSVLG